MKRYSALRMLNRKIKLNNDTSLMKERKARLLEAFKTSSLDENIIDYYQSGETIYPWYQFPNNNANTSVNYTSMKLSFYGGKRVETTIKLPFIAQHSYPKYYDSKSHEYHIQCLEEIKKSHRNITRSHLYDFWSKKYDVNLKLDYVDPFLFFDSDFDKEKLEKLKKSYNRRFATFADSLAKFLVHSAFQFNRTVDFKVEIKNEYNLLIKDKINKYKELGVFL